MPFEPNVGDILEIEGQRYAVAEHPAAPGIAYGQEGRAGIVYRLLAAGNADQALKVFKQRFRLPFLVAQAERIAPFAAMPGLSACRRVVLTPSRHPDLLRQHPDLTYAVLMPWIEGPTWQEILLEKKPLSPEQSLALARGLAEVLVRMEEQGIAHCDLSAPNVMLPVLARPASRNTQYAIELIDLEGLYAPGMLRPQELSSGSAGYAHHQAAGGLWSPEADRFAGAVLLAEMLGFCNPQVVDACWGETCFDPKEMQQNCPRYRLLVDSLRRSWGDGVAALLERAWHSDTLADCPTFGEWLVAMPEKIRPAFIPFRFQSGEQAHDLHELVRLCEKNPAEAIGYLERGKLTPWLESLGLESLARAAAQVQESAVSGPEKLKAFLDQTGVRHSYHPPERKPPPPPAETLEELRARVYSMTSHGQWKEVLNLCNIILSRWPNQDDIAVLSFRARHLADLEEKLEKAWQQALQSGSQEDWEACWKATQTILQQVPQTARYQEMADRAQREVEWAAIVKRAESLVADGHLDEAAALLAIVPSDHLAAGQVRAHIEAERRRRQRAEELFQRTQEHLTQEAWDNAIIAAQTGLALGGSPDLFQPLLEQARRERETDRQVARYLQEADRLTGAREWDRAIDQIDQALAMRPHRTALQARREQLVRFREWAGRLAEARQHFCAHHWDHARALAESIPDDFLDAASLKADIQREIQRRDALQEARRRYDAPRVLDLLADVPPDYPDLDEWRRWAQTETGRRDQLEQARRAYDGQRVLDLLADVSSEYPDLDEWRRWAQAEIERRDQLEQARRACDGQRTLAILDKAPPDYPQAEDLRRWAEMWIAQKQVLEEAWNAGRWEDVLSILNGFPPDYPDRDIRIGEAERGLRQQQRLEQARSAFDEGRWEKVIAICEQAVAEGGDAPALTELYDRARQELETDQQVVHLVAEAEAAFDAADFQQALSLLDRALTLRSERLDLQQRRVEIQTILEREQRLTRAQEAFTQARWADVLTLLADWPADDLRGETLRQEAHQRLIADLQSRANALEATGDWENALATLCYLQNLQSPDPALDARIRQAETRVQAARTMMQACRAREKKQWSKALTQAQEVLRLFPDHPEALALQKEAQQALAVARARRRRLLKIAAGASAAMLALACIGSIILGAVTGGGPVGAWFWTATPTATYTPTPTATPTATSTPTPTWTPTPTFTPTATPTPTSTPTPTPTPTRTPRPTPRPTATRTPTPTIPPSPTPTRSYPYPYPYYP